MESSLRGSIARSIDESIGVKKLLKSEAGQIARAAEIIIACLTQERKVVLFGNGGSAADAQHIAAEFTGRYLTRRRPFPAMALTVNSSAVTAIGNDDGFENVFARQVDAFCCPNDVAVGISTSGNSRNVVLGVEAAGRKGAKTIGLTGQSGGALGTVVDLAIRVPSESTPRIQEAHILIGHIISELVERAFAGESPEKRKERMEELPV